MPDKCLFCSIIDGNILSFKIYEDDLFLCILDRFPVYLGHTLILTKRHAESFFDLNNDEAANLVPLAQKIAEAMRVPLNFQGINLLQNNGAAAGQEISHFHLHLIPRYENDSMKITYKKIDPSLDDFKEMAEKIKGALD